jgi:competence protein ComEC
MTPLWKYSLGFLVLIATTIWLAVFLYPNPKLSLVACDVGQGDAILASVASTQILIDGGPDNKVLGCLARKMPFWDRKIEVVVLTHPQKDHFTGLIEVFRRFQVETLLSSSLDSSSKEFQVLKSVVGGSDTKVVDVTTGTVIRYSSIYLDIVHPSESFLSASGVQSDTSRGVTFTGKTPLIEENILGSYTSSRDPNDFSVVAILRYGDFDALLTGDIGPTVTDEILAIGLLEDVDYIKIPHHGSKNGLTENLLKVTSPEIAVISAGKDNSYGHPHKEVIELLSEYGVKTLRTDLDGDIEIVTDGKSWWLTD